LEAKTANPNTLFEQRASAGPASGLCFVSKTVREDTSLTGTLQECQDERSRSLRIPVGVKPTGQSSMTLKRTNPLTRQSIPQAQTQHSIAAPSRQTACNSVNHVVLNPKN